MIQDFFLLSSWNIIFFTRSAFLGKTQSSIYQGTGWLRASLKLKTSFYSHMQVSEQHSISVTSTVFRHMVYKTEGFLSDHTLNVRDELGGQGRARTIFKQIRTSLEYFLTLLSNFKQNILTKLKTKLIQVEMSFVIVFYTV